MSAFSTTTASSAIPDDPDSETFRLRAQLSEERATSAALRAQVAALATASDLDGEQFATRASAAMEEMATEQQRLISMLTSEHKHVTSQAASLRLAHEENATLQAKLGLHASSVPVSGSTATFAGRPSIIGPDSSPSTASRSSTTTSHRAESVGLAQASVFDAVMPADISGVPNRPSSSAASSAGSGQGDDITLERITNTMSVQAEVEREALKEAAKACISGMAASLQEALVSSMTSAVIADAEAAALSELNQRLKRSASGLAPAGSHIGLMPHASGVRASHIPVGDSESDATSLRAERDRLLADTFVMAQQLQEEQLRVAQLSQHVASLTTAAEAGSERMINEGTASDTARAIVDDFDAVTGETIARSTPSGSTPRHRAAAAASSASAHARRASHTASYGSSALAAAAMFTGGAGVTMRGENVSHLPASLTAVGRGQRLRAASLDGATAIGIGNQHSPAIVGPSGEAGFGMEAAGEKDLSKPLLAAADVAGGNHWRSGHAKPGSAAVSVAARAGDASDSARNTGTTTTRPELVDEGDAAATGVDAAGVDAWRHSVAHATDMRLSGKHASSSFGVARRTGSSHQHAQQHFVGPASPDLAEVGLDTSASMGGDGFQDATGTASERLGVSQHAPSAAGATRSLVGSRADEERDSLFPAENTVSPLATGQPSTGGYAQGSGVVVGPTTLAASVVIGVATPDKIGDEGGLEADGGSSIVAHGSPGSRTAVSSLPGRVDISAPKRGHRDVRMPTSFGGATEQAQDTYQHQSESESERAMSAALEAASAASRINRVSSRTNISALDTRQGLPLPPQLHSTGLSPPHTGNTVSPRGPTLSTASLGLSAGVGGGLSRPRSGSLRSAGGGAGAFPSVSQGLTPSHHRMSARSRAGSSATETAAMADSAVLLAAAAVTSDDSLSHLQRTLHDSESGSDSDDAAEGMTRPHGGVTDSALMLEAASRRGGSGGGGGGHVRSLSGDSSGGGSSDRMALATAAMVASATGLTDPSAIGLGMHMSPGVLDSLANETRPQAGAATETQPSHRERARSGSFQAEEMALLDAERELARSHPSDMFGTRRM